MTNPNSEIRNLKLNRLVPLFLEWFSAHARDLPWRRTRDPYAIWVSEIMLQQTQVKTVIPFWERWMHELPTIETAAKAPSAKIHKLWEGLGYYARARNLQKTARQIIQSGKRKAESGNSGCQFPENYDDVLALPGIGRYTAGAICSIAFNQPTPILDGNVTRVLTRIFGIEKNPREKETNELLWQIAEDLVCHAKNAKGKKSSRPSREINSCSFLNQSLMELGALICVPRNPRCEICPAKKLCVAFKENCVKELPNLGKRTTPTARRFVAFVVEFGGKFLVRRRPAGIVNAHLWEFPNVERNGDHLTAEEIFKLHFDFTPAKFQPLCAVKHSITRYRITLEAFRVQLKNAPNISGGIWLPRSRFDSLAFTAAHKKLASTAAKSILSDR